MVPLNLDWQLRQMGNAADRQRMLRQAGVAISDDRLPQRVTPMKEVGELRGRVVAHVEDERTAAPMLILEGTDGVIHFIRHDARLSAARSEGRAALNHFIAFRDGRVEDLGDADALLRSSHMPGTALPSERASASHHWRGWLGRYHAALIEATQSASHEQELRQQREDLER